MNTIYKENTSKNVSKTFIITSQYNIPTTTIKRLKTL